jgi:hypothetical protein
MCRSLVRGPGRAGPLWLVKPCGGSCGEGIRVVGSVAAALAESAVRGFDCVLQKYIENPLLVAGRSAIIRGVCGCANS